MRQIVQVNIHWSERKQLFDAGTSWRTTQTITDLSDVWLHPRLVCLDENTNDLCCCAWMDPVLVSIPLKRKHHKETVCQSLCRRQIEHNCSDMQYVENNFPASLIWLNLSKWVGTLPAAMWENLIDTALIFSESWIPYYNDTLQVEEIFKVKHS